MSSLGSKKPITYGTVFHPDSGKLFFFQPEESIQVMRAWPKPQAWRRTPDKGWHGFHPVLQIPKGSLRTQLDRIAGKLEPPLPPGSHPVLLPEALRPVDLASLIREQARLRWIGTIPTEVRHALRAFPKHQWHLLRLVAACGAPAMDLMRATPALGVALACARRFRDIQRPLRSWRNLLGPGRSQAEAAGWLGFPDTRSSVRLLVKANSSCFTASALLYLRDIARNPRLRKRASHLPRITRSCIYLLSSPALEPMVSQRLLHEIAEEQRSRAGYQLRDIQRMLAAIHPDGRKIEPLQTLCQVQEFHDALSEEMQFIKLADRPFPLPPVDGNDFIRPIGSPDDLAEESRQMHHCVASYLSDIIGGHVAIYRVQEPERATLSLRVGWDDGPVWVIDQLFLARNQQASSDTWNAVCKWFADSEVRPPIWATPGAEYDPDELGEDDIPF